MKYRGRVFYGGNGRWYAFRPSNGNAAIYRFRSLAAAHDYAMGQRSWDWRRVASVPLHQYREVK